MKTLSSFRRRNRLSEGAADLIKAAYDSQEGHLQDADIPAVSPTDAKADSTVDRDEPADEQCAAADGHTWPLFCETASPAADRALKAQTPTATEAQGPDIEAAAMMSSPFQLNSAQARGLTRAASNRSGEPKAPAPTPQLSNQLSEGNPPVKDVSGDLHAIKQVLELSAVEANKFAVLAQLLASHEDASGPRPSAYGVEITGGRGGTPRATIAARPSSSSSGQLGASTATSYNSRGNNNAASVPVSIARPSAAGRGVPAVATSGGPYEYVAAVGSPPRWPPQGRGGPTPVENCAAMYARAVAARQRAARRHEAIRAQREAAEAAECSFSPCTNLARNAALLGMQRSWTPLEDQTHPKIVSSSLTGKSKPPRTPKLAGRPGSAPLQPSGNPFSSTCSHRIASTPVADASARDPESWRFGNGADIMPMAPLATLGASPKSQRGVVPKVEPRKKQDWEAQEEQEPKEDASIRAGQRLYAEALKSLERQQTAAQLTVQEELEQMKAAAPKARRLPRAVYGAGAAGRVRLIQTRSISPRRRNPAYQELMKECTFQPKTLWRMRSASRAPRSHSLKPPGRDPPVRRPHRASISTDEALDRFLRHASLTTDTVQQLLHLPGGAGSDVQLSADLAGDSPHAPDQGADIAASLELLALGGHASADEGQKSFRGAKSGTGDRGNADQSDLASHGPANGLAPDLDFQEFLQRQRTFMEERSLKVDLTRAQTARRLGKTIGISPGSKRLLRQWKTVKIDRKGSVQKVGKENVARTWSLDATFRPKITPRAQRKKAHSVEELHEGGRLQRERTLEQLRLEALEAEEAQLTFAPAINPCYSIVSRPLLDLADPAPYLAHADAQRRRLEAARQEAANERKVKELAECTFSPRTTPLPAFMQRLSSMQGSTMHSTSRPDLKQYAQQLKWL
ncbi:g10003 [Coccomyxa elongata]